MNTDYRTGEVPGGAPSFRRRFVRTVVVDACVALAFVVVGEIGLRTMLPEIARFVHTDELTGGYPRQVNSRGLREREFDDERPQTEHRVVALGNSTTYGSGVAREDTYAKQLERLLVKRTGHRYFVINAGGEAGSPAAAVRFVESEAGAWDPDVIVFGISPSMVAIAARAHESGRTSGQPERPAGLSTDRPPVIQEVRQRLTRVHRRLYGSYLYAAFDTYVRRRFYELGILSDRPDRTTGAIFAYGFDAPGVDLERVEAGYVVIREALERIQAHLREQNIALVVLGIPSRFELSNRSADNERGYELARIRVDPLDRLAAHCRQLQIPFVDLRVSLREHRQRMFEGAAPWNDLYIPFDYTHLNRQGHEIAALELADIAHELSRTGRHSYP